MMQDRQICKLVHIYSNPRFIVPPCHIAHPELRRRGDGVAGAPFPLSPAPLSALVAAHLCGHQAPPPGPPPVLRPGPWRRSDPRSNSNSKFNETPKENFLADIKPYPSPRQSVVEWNVGSVVVANATVPTRTFQVRKSRRTPACRHTVRVPRGPAAPSRARDHFSGARCGALGRRSHSTDALGWPSIVTHISGRTTPKERFGSPLIYHLDFLPRHTMEGRTRSSEGGWGGGSGSSTSIVSSRRRGRGHAAGAAEGVARGESLGAAGRLQR